MRPTADHIIALYAKHGLHWGEGQYLCPDGEACAAGVALVDAGFDLLHPYAEIHVGLLHDEYPAMTVSFWDGVVAGNDAPVGTPPISFAMFVSITLGGAKDNDWSRHRYEQFLDGYGVGQTVRLHFLKGGSDAAPSPARSGAGD